MSRSLTRPRSLRRLALRTVGAAIADPNLARDFGLEEAGVEARLEELLKGGRPVVAGPWISEVGFEVLYWIPFLRWVEERFSLDPSRVAVVSRGGTGSWYDGLCARYVDILDHLSVGEFQELTEARWADAGGQKQSRMSRYEELILRRLEPVLGSGNKRAVLHPALMYQAFRNYWLARDPIESVLSRTRHERFAIPDVAHVSDELPPGEFAAVKFYFRPSFPDTNENRRFVDGLVSQLATTMPVVLLNTGLQVDEHAEYDPGLAGAVQRRAVQAHGADNLAVQSAIIARAALFVGTYGGLGYLASAFGVPAVTFWSRPEAVKPEHLRLGKIVGDLLDAPLSGVDTGDAEVLGWLAPPTADVGAGAA